MASSSSNEQPIDRISSLPDALLLHILSFLDMSQAVQTGILSSRWMGLWTAIPSLDFDQYQYKNYKGYNPFVEHFGAYTGFFDYDDFTHYNEFDDSDDFGFGFGHRFGHVDVDDDDAGDNADDFIKFVEHSLVLHVAPKINSNQSGDEIGLELRAPNLQMLNLCGVKLYKNSLRNLISLREAYLDIYCTKVNPKFHPTLESWLKDLQHVRLLALSSSCLKVLSFMEELYRPSYDSKTKCLMLESELESLELRGIANLLWRSHDLENLIIELSPSLFVAPDLKPDNDFDNGYWGRLKFSFPCMERRLTTVKISGFMGRKFTSAVGRKTLRRFFVKQDKEIELVRFFLTKAVVLKKMTIQFCDKPDFVEEEEWSKILLLVSQKLTSIPRASSSAELSLLYK